MVKAISALACVANERTIPIDLTGHSLPALGEVPQNSGVSFAVGRFHQAQTFFGLFQAVFWAHWVPDSSGIGRTQRNQDGKVASKQLLPISRNRCSLGCTFLVATGATCNSAIFSYLCGMRRYAFDPCIPTRGTKVPDRPEWLHEIKHDGYRLIVQREGKTVRLWTRNGYEWSTGPRIVEAALRHRLDSFVLDGEAVLLGVDGIADFNGLHSRKHDDEVQLYAFDILMSAGDDLRPLPLHLRKNHLAKMLRRRVDGIILNDFEQGEIGPDLFRHACLMGLEGIVSKHKDQPYRAGRSKHWIKVKNRTSPAMNRPEGMF